MSDKKKISNKKVKKTIKDIEEKLHKSENLLLESLQREKDQNVIILDLQDQLFAKEKETKKLESILTDKISQLDSLSFTIEEITKDLLEVKKKNAQLIKELTTKDQRLATLKEELSTKDQRLTTLEEEIDEIVEDLTSTKESKCWIYTKPIRDLQKVFGVKDV